MATSSSLAPDAPAPGPDAPAGDLGWSLGTVFRTYLKSGRAVVADLPGGPRGHQLLAASAREVPCSQQALGQHIGIDRSVMTYLVDDLAAAGLVERRPDPADRRARRIVLTDAGRARLAELDERLRLVEDHVLSVLEPADRETFRALLRQIAGNAEQLDPMNSTCSIVDEVASLSGDLG